MKITLDVIGCRLNQSEIESFANYFRALGHTIVADAAEADLAIVNTCAVTAKAAADSRKKIRRAQREGAGAVVVTGCWATLHPETAAGLPGVSAVFDNQHKDNLVWRVLGVSEDALLDVELVRKPLPGDRARTRAFIKVQEGCDNRCTYCLTRLARGPSRSRPIRQILTDIHAALRGGAQEIVLSGVQLGAWGRDLEPVQNLGSLITVVLAEKALGRLRLSSIEPWDFNLDWLGLWEDARLCRHIHIPLQSGSDAVLRAMGRPIRTGVYRDLTAEIRRKIPAIALTTDVIAGFPGEREADYQETQDFLREMRFAGGHVFTYSPRPGTTAVSLMPQVPRETARMRNAGLRKIFRQTGRAYRGQYPGRSVRVLWETAKPGPDGAYWLSGLTDNYLRVRAVSPTALWNTFSRVTITGHHPERPVLLGEIIDDGD